MELRPLGFGEIFDRAVTLYVRNFVPFVAIALVMVLPLAIMGYFIALSSQPQYDWMIRVFQHPSRAGTQPIPTVLDSPGALTLLVATILLSYAIWPFVMNAVAVGVARLYRGRPVEFRACYEVVLRRWPQILGLTGIGILVVLRLVRCGRDRRAGDRSRRSSARGGRAGIRLRLWVSRRALRSFPDAAAARAAGRGARFRDVRRRD